MRLLPRRGGTAGLTVTPVGSFRATEVVGAVVTVADGLDQVASARVELGYANSFRYRWAGRADAALKHDDGSFLTMGQVGTDQGSERDTEEWVAVLGEDLPLVDGALAPGTHRCELRLPSWSPGSSASCVRWEVRLRIARKGRDVEETVELDVLVAAPADPPEQALVEGYSIDHTLHIDLVTEQPCYRPGDEVRGTIRLTPRSYVDRSAEVAVYFVRTRASHPLTRTPGSETESQTRPPVVVATVPPPPFGTTTELPFSAVLPADVDPTTEAVHSSLAWYVHARVMFSGLTGGVESARRGIVVHTG